MNLQKIAAIVLVVVVLFALVPLAGAQAPIAPGTAATLPPSLSAKPMSGDENPQLAKLAAEFSAKMVQQAGARYADVSIYTVPAETVFKDLVTALEAEMSKSGWTATATPSQVDATTNVATWTEADNVYTVIYVPASNDTNNVAAVFTIGALVLPDFARG
jgi:hypothetical protein